MRLRQTLLAAGAATLLAAPALAADPLKLAQSQTPGAPFIGIPWQPPVFVPESSFSPPTILAHLVLVYGDSRVANGGGVNYTSPTFAAGNTYANGWAAEIPWQSNNAAQTSYHYNYGVGASSSAGIYGRLSLAGNQCNNGTVASGNCLTGQHTTTSGATTTTTMNVVSGSGVTVGEYVYLAVSGNPFYLGPQVTVAAVSGNTITLSAAPTGSIPNNTGVTFAPAAQVAPFWNGLDVTLAGWALTDPNLNSSNTGQYSACSDPAVLVDFLTGTNDANLPTLQALKNQAAIFDALGPSGCNKLVVSGNEIPRGLATAIDEEHAMAATITVANAAAFYDDQGVIYAPPNAANALGTNDGTPLTKVASAPAVGQYSVASGVYSFNASETLPVSIQYRWTNNTSGAYLYTIHDWLNSSSPAPFVDPVTSVSYAIAGAQYNRPWLTVVDTWDQVLDTAVSTSTNPLPKAFASLDGLHPLPAYGTKVAGVFGAANQALIGSSTPIIPLPTANNPIFSGSVTNSGTIPTLTPDPCGLSGTPKINVMTAMAPAASTGIYAVGMGLYGNAADVASGTTVTCIDTSNNYFKLSAPNVGSGVSTTTMGQVDPLSLAPNAVFSHLDVPATPPTITNCGGHCYTPSTGHTVTQTVPSNWIFLPSASNLTDLNAGILGIGYGVETNPLGDGYDAFIVQVQGQVHTGTLTITLSAQALAAITNTLITVGDRHRVSCKVQVSAGPNGHLWGVWWPQISVIETSSATFTPPGAVASTYTIWQSSSGSGGTGIQMTDADLTNGASGTITAQLTTPNTSTAGMTTPSTAAKIVMASDAPTINASGYLPVSATYRFSRCTEEKVTN